MPLRQRMRDACVATQSMPLRPTHICSAQHFPATLSALCRCIDTVIASLAAVTFECHDCAVRIMSLRRATVPWAPARLSLMRYSCNNRASVCEHCIETPTPAPAAIAHVQRPPVQSALSTLSQPLITSWRYIRTQRPCSFNNVYAHAPRCICPRAALCSARGL